MLPQKSIKVEINQPATMRDGVVLYSDVFRPDTTNKYPAVISRLPYDKGMTTNNSGYLNPIRLAQAGYVVILQDCRGTGSSEGEFYPLRSEPLDGYDTVEWAAIQPWCDGNIGMYGGSYLGFTQWAAASTQPPHLKTICPAMFGIVSQRGMVIEGGVFELNRMLNWFLRMCVMTLLRKAMRGQIPRQQLMTTQARLLDMMDNIKNESLSLPLNEVPNKLVELEMLPFYSDWLTHIDDSKYWQKVCDPLQLEKVLTPAFHICGWYDPTVSGVLTNFKDMKTRGVLDLVRKNQKAVIGPWIHGPQLLNTIGEFDTVMASSGNVVDVTGMHIRWYDHWLKGIDNGIMNEPPLRIFVMGENVWRDEHEWPLARTEYVKYYLHSGGKANSRSGNGVLSAENPSIEQTDVYLYDPRHPVPSTGLLDSQNSNEFGVQDQYEVEQREDVLVYTSLPLGSDIEITGPIELKLWAASSAVDTDFTAKLVDVWPNGKAYNLTQGIVRARYRESMSKPVFINPGKIYLYSIDMGTTSNVFKAGHQIRVQVASSNFPRWDRNLNTGNAIGQDTEMKVAVQTIYHDKQYPSHIVLPLIPR